MKMFCCPYSIFSFFRKYNKFEMKPQGKSFLEGFGDFQSSLGSFSAWQIYSFGIPSCRSMGKNR